MLSTYSEISFREYFINLISILEDDYFLLHFSDQKLSLSFSNWKIGYYFQGFWWWQNNIWKDASKNHMNHTRRHYWDSYFWLRIGAWSQKWSRAKANSFFQENTLVIAKPSSSNTRDDSIHGHLQMVNTKIRLTIFFAAKDGEALYSQQKQDQELTVVQIMNSLLPN